MGAPFDILQGITTPAESQTPEFPKYLLAADNHNLGNSGSSWFDVNPLNIPKYAAVSVLSGLNSFYNTAVIVGNFLGADLHENKTDAWIGSIDSDLGSYYRANQAGADLLGFMVTSIVPGLAGIKILNAGQKALSAAKSGYIGSNLGIALGLKTPAIETYITSAAKEIAAGQSTFTGITQSGFKALSAGVYQNVLEGVAFETAVQATMQASPILSDQSKSDILWNVATGGFLGGVIGGAFASAKTLGAIKREAKEIGAPIQEAGSRALYQEAGNSANKLILLSEDMERVAVANDTDPLQVKALLGKQNRIALDMRAETHNLAGKDTDLGRMVADTSIGQSSDDMLRAFIDTDEIRRVSAPTKVEAARNAALKNTGEIPEELQVQYWKLTGDNMGQVIDRAPQVLNLADTVTGGKAAIISKAGTYGFKAGKYWDAAEQSLVGSNGHLEAEARQIWAANLEKLPEKLSIGVRDFPLLEKAMELGRFDFKLVDKAGGILKDGFATRSELQNYLIAAKNDAAATLQETALTHKTLLAAENSQGAVTEKIGKITNVKPAVLEGSQVGDTGRDYFAWQQRIQEREQFLQSKGISAVKGEEQDLRYLPTWAKVTKVVKDKAGVDGNVLDGMTWIKTQQAIAKQAMDAVVAKRAGKYYDQLPELTDKDLALSDAYGTGATTLGFNNPSYQGPAQKVSLIGSVTSRMSQEEKELFAKEAEGTLSNLARNQEATIEWSALNQKASRAAKQFMPMDGLGAEFGERGLVSRVAIEAASDKDGAIDIDKLLTYLDDYPEHFIPVKTDEAWQMVKHHQDLMDRHTSFRNERAAAQGSDQKRDLGIFRPIQADPKDYPFFAFVKDPTVRDQGHTSMIFASSEKELKQLTDKAAQARPDLQILFKQDTEEFYKARQAYEYDRTLSENWIDQSLKNEGIYSNYFTKTDPQAVVDEFTRHHTKLIDTEVRETIRAKYQSAFDWWEDQAANYSRVTTSKFGGNFGKLEAEGKNPYLSYIKTALNLSRINENPLWYAANQTVDKAVSKVVGAIDDIWRSSKGEVSQEKLDTINTLLQEHGLNTGYYDAATQLLVNHSAPKGELTKFVRGANSVLSRLTLALDPLNSLVNALGANILRTTELKQVTDAIKAGDTELAGEIAKLGKIDVTGAGDLVLSPAKLMAGAIKNFVSGSPELSAFYKSIGVERTLTSQFRSMLEDFTLQGTESVSVLNSKFKSAVEKMRGLAEVGEKYTGNKLAEEFNRFVSADVMRQLTDPAVARGLVSKGEQIAYINTFVNRVEGNIIASQRPFVFQGPIGQAVGLFQSYQFNLMQQMFRYVSEGTSKDAAMLLGLQGTFFGVQGLPAFQAINQHIIGTASGNKDHRDAYDGIYGIAGKNLGDLLTYGIPSNILQTNIYSRGDINPRQVTILPTALNEVPIVGAYTKFFGSMKDTLTKIAGGGNVWESFLQGVEHNGISRPLSGLAQVLQATTGEGVPYSTSNKGNILFSNDLASLATLSRLAGGRPIDEAIINDGVFRIHSYEQYDRTKMLALADSIKSANIMGEQMSGDQWTKFSEEYAARGGKQINFNKFMVSQIKAANTSEAEKIVTQLQNPFAQKMQLLMGGSDSTYGESH